MLYFVGRKLCIHSECFWLVSPSRKPFSLGRCKSKVNFCLGCLALKGVGIAQWQNARLMMGRSLVQVPAGYPFHLCVTMVAYERSRSFAKSANGMYMALNKWHCKWMHDCMMSTESVPRWQQLLVVPAT